MTFRSDRSSVFGERICVQHLVLGFSVLEVITGTADVVAERIFHSNFDMIWLLLKNMGMLALLYSEDSVFSCEQR
jgi:hypothetical protein